MSSTLSLPCDLADATVSALRYYADDPLVRRFRQLVASGTAFTPHRPRELIRIARRHETEVAGVRFMSMLLTGFAGPQRTRMMAAAVARLRQAIADVAEGRESKLIYADHDLLVLEAEQPPPALDWRDVQRQFECSPPPLTSAELAALKESWAKPAAAPASRPAASSSPGFPGGTVFTRPWTASRSRF